MQLPKPSDYVSDGTLTRGAYTAELMKPAREPAFFSPEPQLPARLPEDDKPMEISENRPDFGIILQKM